MSVLVTGGAGYIGSHTVAELLDGGYETVVADNLQKGHERAVTGGRFYHGDVRDAEFMNRVMSENDIDSVIHFAADSLVAESVADPLKYYNNNLVTVLCLLEVMNRYNVKHIVFSSTAATYGEPRNIPILETDPAEPINPYGETKLAVEKALKWADNAYGIKFAALRYFNAAGAHISGEIGEDHSPETHIIPIILQAALGRQDKFTIFGSDYNTPDGTCVRDYIHVTDLADAHIKALRNLKQQNESDIYNLGSSKGFSNKEVYDAAVRVTGADIKLAYGDRRPGDPPALVASSEKIRQKLGWTPKYTELEKIIETAWNWHKNHPKGFNS
ncbi:MAG: UDP-glucose 4-epimerase GalE [Oscillospiraceae bacterium]|nr:UDP-glucose 4-epimerase GalE [Oscillospiraceae bacterium]